MKPRTIITVTLNPAVDRVIEVPDLRLGAHLPGQTLLRNGGGKGVNVSRVLAVMGVASTATGFLGAVNREEFAEVFSTEGITDDFVTIPGRTRENITLTDPSCRDREIHIRDRGAEVPPEAIGELSSRLEHLSRNTARVVFSGSLPPGVGSNALGEMLEVCRGAEADVVLDTSGPALAETVSRREDFWLLKPNVPELETIAGVYLANESARLAAARDLTGRSRNVLLSAGEAGAWLVSADETLHARCTLTDATVRNTVGCGDVLLGAFLAALQQGRQRRDALARAVAAATASAAHPAAGMFDEPLAETLYERTEIRSL